QPANTQVPMQMAQTRPNYERAIRKLSLGIAFLIIAFIPMFSGRGEFWWWMLFPAIPMISKGVGALMQAKYEQQLPAARQSAMIYTDAPRQMPPQNHDRAPNTGELVPPPSVTEQTTRLLDEEKTKSA